MLGWVAMVGSAGAGSTVLEFGDPPDTTGGVEIIQNSGHARVATFDLEKACLCYPVTVSINGVSGRFLLDTGASYVTVTSGFAKRAKVEPSARNIQVNTANGATTLTLSQAARIEVDQLSLSEVPVVVGLNMQDGVDGLLGMSFLGHFDLTQANNQISLRAK